MKKILITGGNGFFCTRFFKQYKCKYNILSLSRQELDVTNEIEVMNKISSFKPDYVIHAAAIANTNFCNENPNKAYDVNVVGSLNIGKACKKNNSKLIFISTEQVFNGNEEAGPYTESHKPIPNTVYGENKLEAENLLKNLLNDMWILRFTWLFGLPERNCGMSANILWDTSKNILNDTKCLVSTQEYRGLTYVYDVIDQFPQIFDLPYGTYHVGSHNNLSRYDISLLIFKYLNLETKADNLLIPDNKKYKENPRDIRLSTDKLKSYGFKFMDSKDSLKKCIEEFKL